MSNVRCPFCGQDMIWQSDFNYDEVYLELDCEGIVSYWICSNCKTEGRFSLATNYNK